MIDLDERLENEVVLQRQLLTEEECFNIIVDNRKDLKTSVITSKNYPINKMVRHSKSSFFEDDHLKNKIGVCNKLQFQFTEYNVTGFYNWHRDDSLGRVYTHIILLNKEYVGGELKIKKNNREQKIKLRVGECISFPSKLLHTVCKINSGIRYSLVGWEHGN